MLVDRATRYAPTSAAAPMPNCCCPSSARSKSRLRTQLRHGGEEVGLFLERGTGAARRRLPARQRRPRRRGGGRARAAAGSACSDDPLTARARRLPSRQPPRRRRARRRAGCAYRHDHVLDDMVRGLGLTVTAGRSAVRARERRLRPGGHGHPHGRRADGEGHAPRIHDHFAAAMNPALMRLLQLASPALPVGAYSYSQGLEWAVEAGTVQDEATALTWIGDLLECEPRPLRGAAAARALIAACAECSDIGTTGAELDDRTTSPAAKPRELRAETLQMGYSLRAPAARTAAIPAGTATPRWTRRASVGLRCRSGAAPPRLGDSAPGRARRLAVGLGREPGHGGAQGRAARPDRRPAHPAGDSAAASRHRRSARLTLARRDTAATSPPGLRHRQQRATKPSTRDCSDHEVIMTTAPARRHRRPGRLRQDGADAGRCARRCATRYNIAVVTNDIYTEEDAAVPRPQRARCRRSASSASRPAAARTRRSARTPRSTSTRSTSSASASPASTWSSSRAAATISPPPSARSCPT